MELDQVKDLTKLYKTAVRLMVNDLKAERAFVACQPNTKQPKADAVYGLESGDIWRDDSLPQVILNATFERGRQIFALDAHKERKFQYQGPAHSIISTPILGLTGESIGLLYCDHSEPGTLGYGARDTLDKFAVEFGKRYVELASSERPKPAAAAAPPPTPSRPASEPAAPPRKGAFGPSHELAALGSICLVVAGLLAMLFVLVQAMM